MTTSTLREARVVMPMPLDGMRHHEAMRRQFIKAFGGYTAQVGNGGWMDPATGEIIDEPVVIYDVAIKPGENVKLYLIARDTAKALGQKAVYIRYPDGVVEIVPSDQSKEALNSPRLVQLGDVWEARDGTLVRIKHKITSADAFVVRPVVRNETGSGPDYLNEYLVNPDGTYMGGMGAHPRDLTRFVRSGPITHVRV